jgi:hypothetical protein
VLQRQVDEYEQEIRALKDFKSPTKRGQPGSRTPRRAITSVSDVTSPRPGPDEAQSSSNSLEATIFRPALQQALRDSWKWQAVATSTTMSLLPPLPSPSTNRSRLDDLMQLTSAISDVRLQKASIRMVDLRSTQTTPREQLQETRNACLEASLRLESQVLRLRASQ